MQPIASGHPAIPRGWLLDLSSTVHKLATRTFLRRCENIAGWFNIIHYVDNVNWPPLSALKLKFWALALRQFALTKG